jgi:hypothetical protein
MMHRRRTVVALLCVAFFASGCPRAPIEYNTSFVRPNEQIDMSFIPTTEQVG